MGICIIYTKKSSSKVILSYLDPDSNILNFSSFNNPSEIISRLFHSSWSVRVSKVDFVQSKFNPKIILLFNDKMDY